MKSPEGDKGVQNSAHVGKARDLGQNSDEGGKVCKILHRLTDSKTVVQNLARRTAKPLWKYFHHGEGYANIAEAKTATL